MAPRVSSATAVGASLTPIEMRLGGGMLALNRLLMTFMNKRMPVAFLTIGRDGGTAREGEARWGEVLRATVLLDCPEETARRYATLLGGLEDVEEIEVGEGTLEVALLEGGGGAWPAEAPGIRAHETEPGGTVVASGDPESMERWLGSLGDAKRDIIRLGPVARPGDGG